ncbi:hypothetical protein ACN47E_010213 [Coniothyrium glycines]
MSQNPPTNGLPTEAQFLANGLTICSTYPPAVDRDFCSICYEPYQPPEVIVRINACQSCYFHQDCLQAWLTSAQAGRGTCPNDRRQLFSVPGTTTEAEDDAPTDMGNFDIWADTYLGENVDDPFHEGPMGVRWLARVQRRINTMQLLLEQAAQTDEQVVRTWELVRGRGGGRDRVRILSDDASGLRARFQNVNVNQMPSAVFVAPLAEARSTQIEQLVDWWRARFEEAAERIVQGHCAFLRRELPGCEHIPQYAHTKELCEGTMTTVEESLRDNQATDETYFSAVAMMGDVVNTFTLWRQGTE